MVTSSLEEGMFLLVSQCTALKALLAPGGVYFNFVPEVTTGNTVCFQLISSQPDTTFDGPSSYNIRRYQFSCFSKDYPASKRMQEALRVLLDGYTGVLPAAPGFQGTKVYNIIRDLEIDNYDADSNNHRALSDYFVHFAL